jgi:HSP20 family molecular chaperone IbpA
MEDLSFPKSNGAQIEQTREHNAQRVSPAVDIFENAEQFLIIADLPGVEPEGLSVEYNPPELRVFGKPGQSAGAEPVVYERRFELGSGIDSQSIQASISRGVLRIELKKSAALRPRRIAVQAA